MTIHGANLYGYFVKAFELAHGTVNGAKDAWVAKVCPLLPGSGPLYRMTQEQYDAIMELAK